MMNFGHLDLLFPAGYLKATLLISLLTVWVLVGLFYYLNRYTRRDYFAIWTAGWLFYALWLTASLNMGNAPMGSSVFLAQAMLRFPLGRLHAVGQPPLPRPASPANAFWHVHVVRAGLDHRQPANDHRLAADPDAGIYFTGRSSLFAGVCFFRLRKQKPFVGAGMLSLGFLLWGLYLGTYPLSQQFGNLYAAGFFVSAVLQLFIAVSMIVLVLEEVRDNMVQKERLHAIGQMAIGMAHDVNNALSPILGYSELDPQNDAGFDAGSAGVYPYDSRVRRGSGPHRGANARSYRRELDPAAFTAPS